MEKLTSIDWFQSLKPYQQERMKPWLWAINKKDPNQIHPISMSLGILTTPLTLLIFYQLSEDLAYTGISNFGLQCLTLIIMSLIPALVLMPLVPLIRKFFYGSDSKNILPRFGKKAEIFLKSSLMGLLNLMGCFLGALSLFLFFESNFHWNSLNVVKSTVLMLLASTPQLLLSAPFLYAKIKLVKFARENAREAT